MKTLDDVIVKMEQIGSLIYSIEGAMIEADVGGGDMRNLHNLVYLLEEQVGQVRADMADLSGHIKVCNAVYAVNRVEEMKAENGALKDYIAKCADM